MVKGYVTWFTHYIIYHLTTQRHTILKLGLHKQIVHKNKKVYKVAHLKGSTHRQIIVHDKRDLSSFEWIVG